MKKINKKKYSIVGAVVLLIIIIVIATAGNGDAAFESAPIAIADVIQDIDVTGKIAPVQKADLAFERVGIVSNVSVKVGDKVVKGQILGALDTREAWASYQAAEASALSERAKLAELEKGTRKEELSISTQTYTNSIRTFTSVIRDTFAGIDNALRTNVDIFFDNTDGFYPRLNIRLSTNDRERELESIRSQIIQSLSKWNKDPQYSNSVEASANLAKDTIGQANVLLDKLLSYIKNPTDDQRSAILQALEDVHTVNQSFIDALAEFENSRGEYVLSKAGSRDESIDAQRAKAEQANAQALSEKAVFEKMTISAPFDGIVTLVEPTIGETMPANTTAFSVMTADQYKIEVFVPESNISKVGVGNISKVTLDAYGKDTFFDAVVERIDPAETIVEGIPTYKVTLTIAADPRIRSGMTADINIITAEKLNIASIPTRALVEKDGKIFARKVDGEKYTEVPVVIGLRGSNGNTELISGLAVGDMVVTKVK